MENISYREKPTYSESSRLKRGWEHEKVGWDHPTQSCQMPSGGKGCKALLGKRGPEVFSIRHCFSFQTNQEELDGFGMAGYCSVVQEGRLVQCHKALFPWLVMSCSDQPTLVFCLILILMESMLSHFYNELALTLHLTFCYSLLSPSACPFPAPAPLLLNRTRKANPY